MSVKITVEQHAEPQFYICKKCHAGCRADVGVLTLKVLGFEPGRTTHDAGTKNCGGEVEVISEGEAGAGQKVAIREGEN